MLSFEEIEDCFPVGAWSSDEGGINVSAQLLRDFAHAIAAKERDACAKAAEDEDVAFGDDALGVQICIVAKIRKRSNVEVSDGGTK